jgi:hypothetical protein
VPADIAHGRPALDPPVTQVSGIPRAAAGPRRTGPLEIGVPALFMVPAVGEFPMAGAAAALSAGVVDGVDAGKNLTFQAG